MKTAAIAVISLALALAAGPCSAIVAGGGSPRTDCFAEFSGVALNFPSARPKEVRCLDGDACDADGIANNACLFQVAICLNQADPSLPGCAAPPDGIAAYSVKNRPPGDPGRDPDLAALEDAVRALLPSTAAECAVPVTITVPVAGPDRGGVFVRAKKVVKTRASTPGGRQDADRLRLVCLPNPAAHADWPQYGFDYGQTRYNPREGLLGRGTVSRLRVRWFFPTDAPVTASPAVVGDVAYVGSWNGDMHALDAFTGEHRWTFNIQDPDPAGRNGFPGIQSSAAVSGGEVYFGAADAAVYALDAASGALVWRTALGDPERAVEGAHVWSSPVVSDGKVYVGKSSHFDSPCVTGVVSALDAATGAEVWHFDVLPENICSNEGKKACTSDADCDGGTCVPFLVCRTSSPGEPQTELCRTDGDCTAPETCQRPKGGGITSSIAVDPGRGAVYVSTGDCVGFGAAGFANSLLALDAGTGALRWSFQATPSGDLKDFDFVASPNLFETTDGATTRALVGAGSKNGIYYALDRDTGALVWQKLTTVTAVPLGGFNASTGVAFDRIYAATFSGPPFIFALRAFDGDYGWQCPDTVCDSFSFSPPGIASGVAFLGDGSGILRAFDAATGDVLGALDLGAGISSGSALVNGMVIVGAGTGGFGRQGAPGVYGLAVK